MRQKRRLLESREQRQRKSENQAISRSKIIRSKFVTVPPVYSSHCFCFEVQTPPTLQPLPPPPSTPPPHSPQPYTPHHPPQKEQQIQVLVRICVCRCYDIQAHIDTQHITHHLGSCISNSENLMVRKDTARLQNAESFASQCIVTGCMNMRNDFNYAQGRICLCPFQGARTVLDRSAVFKRGSNLFFNCVFVLSMRDYGDSIFFFYYYDIFSPQKDIYLPERLGSLDFLFYYDIFLHKKMPTCMRDQGDSIFIFYYYMFSPHKKRISTSLFNFCLLQDKEAIFSFQFVWLC